MTTLYDVWANLDQEPLTLASELARVELLMSGCTTVADDHYIFSGALLGAIDQQLETAQRLGVRAAPTRGSMSVGRELMRESARLADINDVRLHTHLAETAYCERLFGKRPLDYLEDCGWLSDRTWLAHGVHFNDDKVARLLALVTCAESIGPGNHGVRADSRCTDRHRIEPDSAQRQGDDARKRMAFRFTAPAGPDRVSARGWTGPSALIRCQQDDGTPHQ